MVLKIYIFAKQNGNDMTYTKGLFKMGRQTIGLIFAVIFVLYFYGIYGMINASRGKIDKPIEFYAEAIVYNFFWIAATVGLIIYLIK